MTWRETPDRASPRDRQAWVLIGCLIALLLIDAWINGHTDPSLLP
jgi:hypothetical protein